MSAPHQQLAKSLELLRLLQEQGRVALRTKELPRLHRERLLKNGFIRAVMRGWYVPSSPEDTVGESTAWFASFWGFCAEYLTFRFGDEWCLSPEASLKLHAGNMTVPSQLFVRAPQASGNITTLLCNTSIVDVAATVPDNLTKITPWELQAYSLPAALIAVPEGYFSRNPTDARTALAMVKDASDLLDLLLKGRQSVVAGRLAGAFRNIGRFEIADSIVKTMHTAGFDTRENDPFAKPTPVTLSRRIISPYAGRIRLMWGEMRTAVLEVFPKPPGCPDDVDLYLAEIEEVYAADAYHSLSIEGYRVSPELIERVRSGDWNPDADDFDSKHSSALAARGYWEASRAVHESIRRILSGENAGIIADKGHGDWYREMFGPSVQAGILQPSDLAGYRNGPVYIANSTHVPPSHESVRDAMPVFFELLEDETQPAVRAVLGHFVFVYIHPYMDGNGRIGRFLMNAMLASGGYPWTVVPMECRDKYMAVLEKASVGQDIQPFAEFLGQLVRQSMEGGAQKELPRT